MAKKRSPYTFEVLGQAETTFRGPRPKNPELLTEKPDKTHQSYINKIIKAQIESCLQAGNIEDAWKVLKKWQEDTGIYGNPLNVFQRDTQFGDTPYIGAHAFVGALRDSASWLFDCFYEKKEGKSKNLSSKHFKKSLSVRPFHVFFYRPDMKGDLITKPDDVACQQPTTGVGGFSQNEEIYAPFQFKFFVNINPGAKYNGAFEKILGESDKVKSIIEQASLHGLGACRGVGYGMWKIVDIKLRTGIVFDDVDPKLYDLAS